MATIPSTDPERRGDLHLLRRPTKTKKIASKIGLLDEERCLYLQSSLQSLRENLRAYPMQPEFWWAKPRQTYPYLGALSLDQVFYFEPQLTKEMTIPREFFLLQCGLKKAWLENTEKTIDKCLYEWPQTWLALCPHLVVESVYAGRLCFWSADGESLDYAESSFSKYGLFARLIMPRPTMESWWGGEHSFFEGYKSGRTDDSYVALDIPPHSAPTP